jgi:hypothetical protein
MNSGRTLPPDPSFPHKGLVGFKYDNATISSAGESVKVYRMRRNDRAVMLYLFKEHQGR